MADGTAATDNSSMTNLNHMFLPSDLDWDISSQGDIRTGLVFIASLTVGGRQYSASGTVNTLLTAH